MNPGPSIPPRPSGEAGGAMVPRSGKPPDRSAAEQEQQGPAAQGDDAEITGGVYVISVAARILEMHPQTLRKYERVGLVVPSRSIGMLRLYSTEDIVRLRLIKHMVDNLGMNLAGVEFALKLLSRMIKLRERIEETSRVDVLHKSILKEVEEMLVELVGITPRDDRDMEEQPRSESQ